MERSGNSQVFYLKYSKAAYPVDVLKQVSGTTGRLKKRRNSVGSGEVVPSPPAFAVMRPDCYCAAGHHAAAAKRDFEQPIFAVSRCMSRR